jgi:hypothetical protein
MVRLGEDGYYPTYVEEPLTEENAFLKMKPEREDLPSFEEAKGVLPEPFWAGHEAEISCYWRAWELAFRNIREPEPGSGFVTSFIDTAFNDCLFMWDSAFILLFARYGRRAFDFQRTLDNLYAKQHPDGFICREISTHDGRDRFHRFDPGSTGPNVMPWTEWEHYLDTGDRERLARIFAPLVAYHRWMRSYRTWPDGTYWSSGFGCGADNQPRFPERSPQSPWSDRLLYHGHLIWVDACLQQILSADRLLSMAGALGRTGEVTDLAEEQERLARTVNERLWDEGTGFYFDGRPDGTLSDVKIIGAYWALLAGVVPAERLERFVGHLESESEFERPHRVPSISADHPDYHDDGGYWMGGVWPPTNYMVLRGLSRVGREKLAHEIGRNHVEMVTHTFEETGTLWENYAPESATPGKPAKGDFVGWAGLPPVAVLLEYVFGLRSDAPNGRLVWDVRLTEEHGVRRYPFGLEGTLDLSCVARSSQREEPRIEASSSVPVELTVRWAVGEKKLSVGRAKSVE